MKLGCICLLCNTVAAHFFKNNKKPNKQTNKKPNHQTKYPTKTHTFHKAQTIPTGGGGAGRRINSSIHVYFFFLPFVNCIVEEFLAFVTAV